MGRLTEIAPGVLVATSAYAMTTSTVVIGSSGGCLLIDPAVTVDDLAALAGELAERGLRPVVGLVDPPALGSRAVERRARGRAQVRRARRGQPGRDGPGRHPRVPQAIRARSRPGPGRADAGARRLGHPVGRAGGPADRARRARARGTARCSCRRPACWSPGTCAPTWRSRCWTRWRRIRSATTAPGWSGWRPFPASARSCPATATSGTTGNCRRRLALDTAYVDAVPRASRTATRG